MNEWQRWPSPAKINLFLHVTGRRANGYHELQTLFQFIDLSDALELRLREDGEIRLLNPLPDVPPEADLCVRAARLLQARFAPRLGVDLRCHKAIPMGGGLGGGSSNAATVLVALNRLWRLERPLDELAQLGLSLGADVPIFVHGRAAWAEGVGEAFAPVDPPEPWYLLVVPPVHVPTAEIFSDSQLTRDCDPITIRDFLAGAGSNVCEPVVRRRYPEVGAVLDWLSQRLPARMTGTGACCFGRCESREQAQALLEELPSRWRAWVVRGQNRSPLHGQGELQG